ncbi:MAG TPA: penicillin-binding protein 2 [Ignavibacteriales bacterium]|nr:penicillin-binding protein 2 [Ignavibacteriales bacterium]HOL81088.1 penicillin-binding protein 2 [Ignavibacteriales bacterium]HPD66484.1 penicillin-binding protein 2 [Ignavibacteriales bacterium]HPP34467.1 penicillin-binding protein 2 [Ignavibacteriales bacterium]HRR19265.1 penicillin-binding protein 2 [Ignavibacteriales bacterium]
MKSSDKFYIPLDVKTAILKYIVIIISIIYTIQLFYLQIINNEYFDVKSKQNSIKGIPIQPIRGVFLDRNLEVLVDNKNTYTVKIIPAYFDTSKAKYIEAALNLENGTIVKYLRTSQSYSPYIPIRIKKDAPFKNIAWIEENKEFFPGLTYSVELQRSYPVVSGSHMFGYLKEISKKQLEEKKDIYTMGDLIGYCGIEKTYEDYIRGEKGYQYIIVDSRQRQIGRYNDGKNDKKPQKGYDLVLGIDKDVQKVAEEKFKGLRGALVAIEPQTGELIAFVSSPEYDLSKFSAFTDKAYWDSLISDPNVPLFNRATMSINPPGSTYKILAAIAALEEGVIDENTIISCPGSFVYGNRSFKCHGAHGNVNVIHAIEHSCNVFFYKLIFKIGLDKWAEYARKFGFGQKTNIDITEEVKGLVPDTKYYNKRYGKNGWTQGFLVSLGIGQGELSVTPMQLALYTAIIANNGVSYQPHIVKGYLKPGTKEIVPFTFPKIQTNISQRTFDIVKQGMYLVVNGHGTATSIKMPDIPIAGKTGTAQNPHGKDHAYFIGYAPADNPKLAIACFVENAGFGATWAAPIVKEVVHAYFNKHKNVNYKDTSLVKSRKN